MGTARAANRLTRECAKLAPEFKKKMAEEGIAGDGAEWPEILRGDIVRAGLNEITG